MLHTAFTLHHPAERALVGAVSLGAGPPYLSFCTVDLCMDSHSLPRAPAPGASLPSLLGLQFWLAPSGRSSQWRGPWLRTCCLAPALIKQQNSALGVVIYQAWLYSVEAKPKSESVGSGVDRGWGSEARQIGKRQALLKPTLWARMWVWMGDGGRDAGS